MATKKKRKPVRPNWFQKALLKLGRKPVGAHLKKKYGFEVKEMLEMDEPFICMSNHLTDNDMVYLMLAIKNHMYFVCSEHLFRSGLVSRLMVLGGNPIPLFKGGVATSSTAEIMRRMKDGNNIAIFPEGSRTFNGRTNPINPSTGKLVKKCKCALVTYHLEGGYFVAPRWSSVTRRGPISGHVVNVYSSKELAAMSVDQINEIINRDLWEDAYDRQKKNPQKYIGENKASGLENYLYYCPNCHGFETIRSQGDDFWCTACDMKGHYDDYGMLSGEHLRFTTVPEWGDWENTEFDKMYDETPDLTFTSKDVTLIEIAPDHKTTTLAVGTLTGDKDGLHIGEFNFPFSEMIGTEYINLGNTFLFATKGHHYSMTSAYLNGIKYRKLYFRRLGIDYPF